MALDFPSPATPGQTYVNGGVWIYDGVKWNGAGGGGAYLPLTGGNESGQVNFAPGPAACIALWQASPPGSTSVYLQLYNDGNSHIAGIGGQLYLDCTYNVWISGSANGKGLVVQNTGGHYLHIWDDGNTHFASSNGQPIWLDAPVNTGYLTCGDFYSSGNVNTNGTYHVQGRAVLSQDTSYTNIRSPYGNTALFLGSPAVDATNYYRNNIHSFRFWDDTNWAEVQCGIFRSQSGRTISQNANYYPGFCCHWPGNYAAGMFMSGTNLYFGNMDGAGTPTGNVNFGYFESNGHFNLFNGLNVTGSIAATGNVNGVALVASDALYCGGMYWHNDGSFMHTPWAIRTDNYIRIAGLDISNNNNCLYAANLWSGNDVMCTGVVRRQPIGSPYKGTLIEMWAGCDWDAVSFGVGGGNFMFSYDRGINGVFFPLSIGGGFSDARLKDYIRDTAVDALAAILATPVRAFSWNPEGLKLQPYLADNPHVEIGFVAQEVEKTMPTAVQLSPFDGDTLHISYHAMTPYLVRAIQQLVDRVEQLTARVQFLEAQ